MSQMRLGVLVSEYTPPAHEGIAAAASKEALDRAARDYLLQKNIARRHYTQGQRAALSAQMATMPQGVAPTWNLPQRCGKSASPRLQPYAA